MSVVLVINSGSSSFKYQLIALEDAASTEHEVLASGLVERIGDVELWEIENRSGGWFHPVHIHLVDFAVVWRNTNGGQPFPWERGPKDVVYVGEDEKVRVLARFSVGEGRSLPRKTASGEQAYTP